MIGDKLDFFERTKTLIPDWFGEISPIFDSLIQGNAVAEAFIYDMIQFVAEQCRIQTTVDGFLDIASIDFFAGDLPRFANETDSAFRTRIIASIFRLRGTRPAMRSVLLSTTGLEPELFEPSRPADCLCLGVGALGVGKLGNLDLPYQAFAVAHRTITTTQGRKPGLNAPMAGLNQEAVLFPDDASRYALSDADILNAINKTKPEGTVTWIRIQ